MNAIDTLGGVAAKRMQEAAAEKLLLMGFTQDDLNAHAGTICEYIRTEARKTLSQALDDAQAALDANMETAAVAGFMADMQLAGCRAATAWAAAARSAAYGPEDHEA